MQPIFLAALLLAMFGGWFPACASEGASAQPQIELVAPGIWRLRFGNPESFTPTHFRSAPADTAGLTAKAFHHSMPLDTNAISFRVSDRGCSLLLPLKNDEAIYGFGLNTKLFDLTQSKGRQMGRRISVIPTDSPENDLGESHAPVPFYVSASGYGVFVDTARFATVYLGDVSTAGDPVDTAKREIQTSTAELYRPESRRLRRVLADVPAAKGLDLYLFAGPTMLDAVERYNLFSGGGAVPPLWGLGVQYRGYAKFGAEESLALAARLRAAQMPCDVWGLEPGWQSHAYSCSFVWDTNHFPDPDGFIAKMHGMGFRLNLWEHAFTHPSSPIHDELKPWSGNYLVWGGFVPDFATTEGRKIFLRQNRVALFDRQIEAVKLDECDYQPESPTPFSFPPATAFPSGLDGEQMHSLLGLLYQQTMLEPCSEKNRRTWGLVRNSHALASSLPYVIYSDSYDHRCYVRGLANSGFTGLLWTPEVRHAASSEDLYRRIQTVIFSADALINAWYIPNLPWEQVDREKNKQGELMPDREAVTATVRKLLQLRMSFIPYLYSAFNEYHSTGKPPIRALVLDWPSDPKVHEIDDQFMFGDSVMVAPIFAGEKARQVYLPAGDWYDFWTHAKLRGGTTIEATNGIEQVPLFIKSGTLLPLAEPVECVKPDASFNVTVNIVGKNPADFTLYEDDGITTAYAGGAQNQLRLHANGGDGSGHRTGNYRGPARYQITGWKRF